MLKHIFTIIIFSFGFFINLLANNIPEIEQNQINSDSLRIIHFNKLAYENLKSDPVKSYENASQALLLAEKNDIKTEIINALLLMGIVKKNFGRFDEAALYYFRALSLANTLLLREKQSVCYNNIGSLYQTQNNYIKALEYFKKSLDIERQSQNREQISIRLYNMGVVYEAMDSLDLAYTYYLNSLLIEQEEKNKEGEFYAFYGISGIETKKGFYEKAMSSINKALNIAKEINDANGISLCYSELGTLYKTTGNFSKALIAFDSSIIYADLVFQKNNIRLAYKELSELHSLKGDFEKAYSYLKLFTILNDSINNAEINTKVAELEAGFQLEKWEKEVHYLTEKALLTEKSIITEKRYKYFLLIAFILAVVLTVSNLKRILPDTRNLFIFSILTFILLLFIATILVIGGFYGPGNEKLRFLYAFVDVLTIAVFPVFAGLLLLERMLLKKNIKIAEDLSSQINDLKIPNNDVMLTFVLEGEKKIFEVRSSELVCIEANDNYPAFYFYRENKIVKELHRISLKNIENQLLDCEDIMRCHKSYIVNIRHIKKITGNAQGYKLHFSDLNFEIPVSRKFPKDILIKIKNKLK
ncbi:MAG: LytTR family transcriptional regulator [Bacteroidales bacterium]|nr:LytTR family transcriptional regulator [Bacteroidales bacterium]